MDRPAREPPKPLKGGPRAPVVGRGLFFFGGGLAGSQVASTGAFGGCGRQKPVGFRQQPAVREDPDPALVFLVHFRKALALAVEHD